MRGKIIGARIQGRQRELWGTLIGVSNQVEKNKKAGFIDDFFPCPGENGGGGG